MSNIEVTTERPASPVTVTLRMGEREARALERLLFGEDWTGINLPTVDDYPCFDTVNGWSGVGVLNHLYTHLASALRAEGIPISEDY